MLLVKDVEPTSFMFISITISRKKLTKKYNLYIKPKQNKLEHYFKINN